jgi:hypothetical protein
MIDLRRLHPACRTLLMTLKQPVEKSPGERPKVDIDSTASFAWALNAMLKYYRMGIHSFLIRGFDPVNDVSEYGRELIPRLKLGAQEIDAG